MKRVMGVIVTVALTAALGLVAWNSLSDDQAAPAPVLPTGSPSATVTPDDRASWSDPRGFTVSHPADWERSIFEGDVQLRPKGLPSVEQGGDTFAVTVQVDAGSNDPVPCSGEDNPNPGTTGSTTINGETVATCDQTGDDGDDWYRRTYTFAWSGHTCDHISLGCPSKNAGITLTVRIVAAKKSLWDLYINDGAAIVESARRSEPRPNEDYHETIDR